LYLTIGDHASAMEIANTMMNRNNQLLDFYGKNRRASNEQDIQFALFQMQIIVESLKNAKAPEAEKYERMFQQQLQKLSS
jgi:N-acetylglucosamine kinase-like BadF-type ATPase